ncbi:MAG: 5'-3' exonuclease H3TH domain-containing protein [bacterium]
MKTLVLIDGNSLIHRAYHALPPFKTKKGELVNAVYGFTSILLRVIQDLKPDCLAVSFDLAGPTFRNLQYKEYKAKRVKPPQDLYDQIPWIKKIVKAMDIPIYEKKGFEADDVIGTVVEKVKDKGIKIIIITGDLDALQLVNRHTEVYAHKKGIKDIVVYNEKEIKKRYGLSPEQVIDFKGLKGDSSDNIPGVPGVGEKIAIQLVKKFNNLEKLYKKLETSDLNPKLKARLLEYKEQAFFSKYLATIRKDVPIDFDLKKCKWGNLDQAKIIKLLERLGFKSLIKRLSVI